MLENFGLTVAGLLTLCGAFLLLGADSAPDVSAPFRLLGGATAVTAGFVTAALIVRSKLRWRRIQRQTRDHV